MNPNSESSSNGGCACSGGWPRRDFLKAVGLGTAAAAVHPWEAMAGPFTRADFEKLVPRDKKLRPEWVKSLFERGERTVYRGSDLDHIGMPIGGLCAGQVYLSGDGRLMHWDIFNQHIGTGAEHYAKPMAMNQPFMQDFHIRVTSGTRSRVRRLCRDDWRDVSFNGQYPIGRVEYRDPEFPVSVDLEAFSPFIPLNTADSSLPATVMRFRVRNTSDAGVSVQLGGILQNAICLHTGKTRQGFRCNRLVREENALILEASAEDLPAGPGELWRLAGRRRGVRERAGRNDAHSAVPGRCGGTRASGGQQPRLGAGRVGRGEGPGTGDAYEQGLLDRAGLHHVSDRRGGPCRPHVHELADRG